MDSSVCIHVGLHAPSSYPQLRRSFFSKESGSGVEDLDTVKQEKVFPEVDSGSRRFNITVGKFNPKTGPVPLAPVSILKQSPSTQSEGKSSQDGRPVSNLDSLSSLSSYDFSKIGSNSTGKSVVSGSDEEKSVKFSDQFSSTDSIKVGGSANLEAQKELDLSRESSKDREGDQGNPGSNEGAGDEINLENLMGIFRNAVKHVINVNRFRKPDDFISDFFGMGSDRIENVGFSDDLKNNPSLNQSESINQPLLNKGSTNSLYESQAVSSNVKTYCLNKNFNKRVVKLNEKYSYLNELLEKLEDPLSSVTNDAPLSNILEEHVNTWRLVHPCYINYYPAKVEEEEEEDELESFRKVEPAPVRKRNWRPEDYPSMWAIFTNPKNGITSTP